MMVVQQIFWLLFLLKPMGNFLSIHSLNSMGRKRNSETEMYIFRAILRPGTILPIQQWFQGDVIMMSPEVMWKRILLYFDWFFSNVWFFNPADSEPKKTGKFFTFKWLERNFTKVESRGFLIPEEGWSVCHHLRIDISNIFAQPKS